MSPGQRLFTGKFTLINGFQCKDTRAESNQAFRITEFQQHFPVSLHTVYISS